MAVVDPQDLHLYGIRRQLSDDSILIVLPIKLIEESVNMLKHWWHKINPITAGNKTPGLLRSLLWAL